MSKKLNELNEGETGIICALTEGEDIKLKRHLLSMGFVKGAKIKLEKIAPLGDPLKFKIKGYNVCLRRKEAENILIEDGLCLTCNHSREHVSHRKHNHHVWDKACKRHRRFGFF